MDARECNESETAQVAKGNTDTNHQHEEEACNPFCACNCCGQIFTPAFQLHKTALVKPAVQKQQHFYTHAAISSSYLNSIWQPPKYS